MRKKKILKIYNKLIQIAQKGRDNFIEYYNYIDDTIDYGDYNFLIDVFDVYFNVIITQYKYLSDMKRQTFDIVCNNTNTSFQNKIYSYYNTAGVYQIGKEIHDSTTNEILGFFTEADKLFSVNLIGITYSYTPKQNYYEDTNLFTKLYEIKDIELQIIVGSHSNGQMVILGSPTMSLLDKYKTGITILKTS